MTGGETKTLLRLSLLLVFFHLPIWLETHVWKQSIEARANIPSCTLTLIHCQPMALKCEPVIKRWEVRVQGPLGLFLCSLVEADIERDVWSRTHMHTQTHTSRAFHILPPFIFGCSPPPLLLQEEGCLWTSSLWGRQNKRKVPQSVFSLKQDTAGKKIFSCTSCHFCFLFFVFFKNP